MQKINRTVKKEYSLAKKEKRQPLCVYCGEPLNIMQEEKRYVENFWQWHEVDKKYHFEESESDDFEIDNPQCEECWKEDEDFIDDDLVQYE